MNTVNLKADAATAQTTAIELKKYEFIPNNERYLVGEAIPEYAKTADLFLMTLKGGKVLKVKFDFDFKKSEYLACTAPLDSNRYKIDYRLDEPKKQPVHLSTFKEFYFGMYKHRNIEKVVAIGCYK